MLRGFSDASSVDELSGRVLALATSGRVGTSDTKPITDSNSTQLLCAPINAYARASRCTV